VEAVLTLAVRWQLDQVVDACCSFLGDHLRPSNCLAVLRLAADNDCSGLKSVARFYIAVIIPPPVGEAGFSIARLCTHVRVCVCVCV